MTDLQRIALRQSEIRTRLHDLGVVDDQTDETRSEIGTLATEMKDLEIRSQALIAAGEQPEEEPEDEQRDDQLAALAAQANAGEIFDAALERRSLSGATRELQEELDLAHNQVPLMLLETRAVTPAPADVGSGQSEIIPGVFPDSCASYLGVDMPTVPVGEAVFPVLTTNATAGTPAENAEQDETTGAFSADLLAPSRIQAAFFYSREDRARFAGMDAALRMNLSDALADKLDQQILNGDGRACFNGTNLAAHTTGRPPKRPSRSTSRSLDMARVDGKYASDDGRPEGSSVGSETYSHMGGARIRHNNADDISHLPRLMDITARNQGVRARSGGCIGNKQNAVIRLGMRRDMVAAIWEGVTIIPDEFTKADNRSNQDHGRHAARGQDSPVWAASTSSSRHTPKSWT